MAASLSVIVPNPIGTANLVSSNVPETDYAAWSSATTYTVGQRCISTVTHRVYESLQASNLNKDPTNMSNRSGTPAYWLDVGPTNRWAMLDDQSSTQTQVASPLIITLTPGVFTAVYIAAVDADQVDIVVKDKTGGEVIFTYSGQLEDSAPSDYDEYFFDPFKPLTDLVVSGIEQYGKAEITMTLSKGSGIVKCGVMVMGEIRSLGKTQYGAKAKPKSYSYIKTDDFGNTTIKRRKATTDMSATAQLDLSEANTVLSIVRGLLDIPAVWIGSDLPEYGGLRVYGLGSGELSYPGPGRAQLDLSVMGVISTSSQ